MSAVSPNGTAPDRRGLDETAGEHDLITRLLDELDDVPDTELALRESMLQMRAALRGVLAECAVTVYGATRWQDPLPVPAWVHVIRRVVAAQFDLPGRCPVSAQGNASGGMIEVFRVLPVETSPANYGPDGGPELDGAYAVLSEEFSAPLLTLVGLEPDSACCDRCSDPVGVVSVDEVDWYGAEVGGVAWAECALTLYDDADPERRVVNVLCGDCAPRAFEPTLPAASAEAGAR